MLENLVYLVIGFCLPFVIFFVGRKLLNWGAHDVPCSHFHDHVHDAAPSRFVRDIQRDAPVSHDHLFDENDHEPDPLGRELEKLVEECALHGHSAGELKLAHDPAKPEKAHGEKVLMLSGGGQWGAYGAGLFRTLHDASGNDLAMRGVRIITGISTGSLQTLLLMVALDEKARPETRRYAMERLEWGYSPKKESEVVLNTGLKMLPFRGAQAGTTPLRRRIRDAIYENGDGTLLDALRQSSIAGYIGFVEANCGQFHYVDVRGLVRDEPDNERAVDALCAAAMASSAMPVFHQQLRVTGSSKGSRVLYDGGVRRSVFFERSMERMHDHVCKHAGLPEDHHPAGADRAAVTPAFFVVRNGPTVRIADPDLDSKDDPILNGKRGYDLLVNESEVGAIAGLRLLNPYGDIYVTTADQWDSFECTCPEADCKKEGEMFKPGFMACLRDLGRHKAQRSGGPWWPLSPIDAR
ncbi:hypothetical protein GRI42_10535 [Erythrobacter gaetbuli]|uniref:PNPLA domain-containing protein n=1 Tax=Qipengyuania gaetbuli TaxID=266952 RepID=A0A844Y2H8_9SPHN|nr:patatin-like phospholipase family protein [Qipengyuania gaetbuli]MXO51739.1 hypothetical protein [Qipengyuania gaetbuli]